MSPEKPQTEGPKTQSRHTGPTTPAEEASREAHPAVVPPSDKAKIAEEASREQDA